MKKIKKYAAFAAAIAAAAALPCQTVSGNNMVIEVVHETHDAKVTVDPQNRVNKISPYIYGINDKGNISGISPTVIKQTGAALSGYNWETNYSNAGEKGHNSNDISLVDNFPSSKWSSPGLYTDSLVSRALINDIPVKLVTLQMMGYVANDSMGIVSSDKLSKNTRWSKVSFNKNGTYLNKPDIDDNMVYIDEYVSFLVNRYGSADEGGINGYFLDTEPDLWADNFAVLGLERITPDELVTRSAELSEAVKAIDSSALVFGPSLSGLQGCINLNDSDSWNEQAGSEYSWFIDYYLSQMRVQGEMRGYRLLDVLDIHYYTEAMTPVGIPVLTSNDDFSNAYRMQAVKTLWDSDYTENSVTVLMNKQFTPVIPTLQASIRINYPGTKLSFSEYDFGGGDNISGAITQTDVLGNFASSDVYLACLSPVSDNYKFQKAAMRLYTNYDGEGSSFGDTVVYSDNDNDSMSSVFSAVSEDDPDELRIILTNKNMVNNKKFDIQIQSEDYDYELSAVYTIDDNADIVSTELDDFTVNDNLITFEADTTSVYMLVLKCGEKEPDIISEMSDTTSVTEASETEQSDVTETQPTTVSETEVTCETVTTESVIETAVTDEVTSITETTVTTETVSNVIETSPTEEPTETVSLPADEDSDKNNVAMPIKVFVSFIAAAVGLGVVYILIFDKK